MPCRYLRPSSEQERTVFILIQFSDHGYNSKKEDKKAEHATMIKKPQVVPYHMPGRLWAWPPFLGSVFYHKQSVS